MIGDLNRSSSRSKALRSLRSLRVNQLRHPSLRSKVLRVI